MTQPHRRPNIAVLEQLPAARVIPTRRGSIARRRWPCVLKSAFVALLCFWAAHQDSTASGDSFWNAEPGASFRMEVLTARQTEWAVDGGDPVQVSAFDRVIMDYRILAVSPDGNAEVTVRIRSAESLLTPGRFADSTEGLHSIPQLQNLGFAISVAPDGIVERIPDLAETLDFAAGGGARGSVFMSDWCSEETTRSWLALPFAVAPGNEFDAARSSRYVTDSLSLGPFGTIESVLHVDAAPAVPFDEQDPTTSMIIPADYAPTTSTPSKTARFILDVKSKFRGRSGTESTELAGLQISDATAEDLLTQAILERRRSPETPTKPTPTQDSAPGLRIRPSLSQQPEFLRLLVTSSMKVDAVLTDRTRQVPLQGIVRHQRDFRLSNFQPAPNRDPVAVPSGAGPAGTDAPRR